MQESNFNPVIEAVVSIRQLAIASSKNWTAMKDLGQDIKGHLNDASALVKAYGSDATNQKWKSEINTLTENLGHLKVIMDSAISKIKSRQAVGLADSWNNYQNHVESVKNSFTKLELIGREALPENRVGEWTNLWGGINSMHLQIEEEAKACSLQLRMIEEFKPDEVDELSDTILKHIPSSFSVKDANQYNKEYMRAFRELKEEAKKKKNLWDRFLDVLAGGAEQTPAQRVMMQRWVDGEKGELH